MAAMSTPDVDPAEQDDQTWRGFIERWMDRIPEIDEKGRADE